MSKRPIWPLNAPGMAPLAQDFLDAARSLGGSYELAEAKGKQVGQLVYYSSEVAEIVRRCLYGGGQFTLNMTVKQGKRKPMMIVSGHRWGADPQGTAKGPEPCDVMVVGKMLGDREVNMCRCMIGPTGQHFLHTLRQLGVPKISKWYITNILKTENPDPSSTSLKASWISSFQHLLEQEIRLVNPKFILCLGSDAVKAVLGRNMTIGKMNGRVVDIERDFRKSDKDPPDTRTIQVMACEHPASVTRDPSKQDKFELDLSRFHKLLRGVRWDQKEEGIDHRTIRNELELKELLEEAEANNPKKIVAVDAEWHGQHPQNKGAYLRCVQISWAHKKAACIALRKEGGEPTFGVVRRDKHGKPIVIGGQPLMTTKGGQKLAFRMLKKYFKDKRVCGHFLNADLEWLVFHGLDLRPQVQAPDNFWECKTKGGWDTGLMAHALVEDGLFNLTDQALRYTEAPRYDIALDNWKVKFCRRHKLKPSQLEGFGECPESILYPYACYDADVTRRLALRHAKALDRDAFGNNCWEAFWVSQRALLPVFEINTTGLPVDRDRLDQLTELYMDAARRLEQEIKIRFRWPKLKLDSVDHVRELLFGEELNGKKDDEGNPIRLRPLGAESLKIMPAITTERRPREWQRVIEEGKEAECMPSTNKMALGILLRESKKMKARRNGKWVVKDYGKEIEMIRNYRFIKQILKSVLRKPVETDDEYGEPWETDDSGNYIYEAGLPGLICIDNCVRTFISQVKETGRWSSSRPPLQNLSKRREPDYKRILGGLYQYPLRSIFYAGDDLDKHGRPKYVLVEADYVGAELFGMAIMSGDALMIEHAIRNQLPEDDPNFYDIHSNIAVLAFGYKCEPTKNGLRSIGMEHMRIVAKSVVFGVAYGRRAKAIALAAREEGVSVTVEEAQRVVDTIFLMYPKLVPFFEECRSRAVTTNPEEPSPRWICGPFGRFRRFPITSEREVMGEFERQAMNFPIQGMIADAVSRAVDHLQTYRDRTKMGFRLLLQVHDALLFKVPCTEVPEFIDKVLPLCMSKMVPIFPCQLDGTPIKGDPYYLGTDNEISIHWGEHMFPNECWDREIPESYARWSANANFKGGWKNSYFGKKVWLEKTQQLHPIVSDSSKREILKSDAVELAVQLGKLPRPDDMKVALKSIEDKELVKLIVNERGEFATA